MLVCERTKKKEKKVHFLKDVTLNNTIIFLNEIRCIQFVNS